ncbi:AAA family ATPase [Chloroflexota bacterium]
MRNKLKKKTGYKNTSLVWDRTIFVDLLSEFKPEKLGYRDYQFTFGKPSSVNRHGTTISIVQTVRIFNFDVPNRGSWSVEMVVKEDNVPFFHSIVHPQNQMEWQQLFEKSGVIPSAAERFRQALTHSHNKAQKAVEDLSLEYYTDRESIDIENWPFTEQIEIVPKFAMQGGYTILFGEPGVGKSILAHNIGLSSAAGIMGGSPGDTNDPIVVYYLSLEMGYVQFRERHNELSKHFRDTIRDNFIFSCPDSFDFSNQRDRSMLYNTLSEIKAKLLIVDGHSYWIGNKDDNKNTDMSDHIVVPLKRLAKELELGVILLHHSGWNDNKRIRGASVLWAGAEIGIFMESDPIDSNKTTISFKKWRPTSIRKPKPVTYTYDPQNYTMRVSGEADFLDKLNLGLPANVKKTDYGIDWRTDAASKQ